MATSPGDTVTLSIEDVSTLTQTVLEASNTSELNARSVTRSVVASELDGIHSHGLARLPTYCEHAACAKVNGHASPTVEQVTKAGLRADAQDGFAHPAIDLGFSHLVPLAKSSGIAGLSVTNSYNCGVLGYHVEALAREGLIGLAYTNAPASIAPAGGRVAVFGTNPVACAAPDGAAGAAFVIDQSSSVVARSEILVHAANGEAIPHGWAYDENGQPTKDSAEALKGTMVPAGGYKGAGTALMVELMAAALSGATLSSNASSFGSNEGGPPRTGQFFIALDPGPFSGGLFADRLTDLVKEIARQDGARLPGVRRLEARKKVQRDGVTFSKALHEKLVGYTA